jgi:hypothetical protein
MLTSSNIDLFAVCSLATTIFIMVISVSTLPHVMFIYHMTLYLMKMYFLLPSFIQLQMLSISLKSYFQALIHSRQIQIPMCLILILPLLIISKTYGLTSSCSQRRSLMVHRLLARIWRKIQFCQCLQLYQIPPHRRHMPL